MATDNKSPSYLEERRKARNWLTSNDPNAKMAKDYLTQMAPGGDAAKILDEDQHVDWAEIVREHQHDAVVAASNREARAAFKLSAQSTTMMMPPAGKAKWRKVASVPSWYHIRRMCETADPKYWDDPINRYREFLNHPEWCIAPMEYFRGELEAHLPKGKR